MFSDDWKEAFLTTPEQRNYSRLAEAMRTRNLLAIEEYAGQFKTYAAMMQNAREQGVDCEELEELLYEI